MKCRSSSNRIIKQDEVDVCLDYLRNQVVLIKPKIIVLLGDIVLKNILGNEYLVTYSRGKWIERKGIYYMITWNPIDLLRDESKKIQFWNDIKEVRKNDEKLWYLL